MHLHIGSICIWNCSLWWA